MSRGRIGVLATGVVLAACTAAPAASPAAAIGFSRPCYPYVAGSVLTIVGAGFTPGDTIELDSAQVFTTAPVGANGTFAVQAPVPTPGFILPGFKTFSMTARSQATAQVLAASKFRVANFAVKAQPARARPSTTVKYLFSGFGQGRPIYGHYFLHGKLRTTKRFGTAKGACGTLKAKSHLYPGSNPRFGTYKVQFDQARKFRKQNVPRLVTKLRIFRTFHL